MKRSKIEKLLAKHEAYRSEGINLIASENYLSAAVRKALGLYLEPLYMHCPSSSGEPAKRFWTVVSAFAGRPPCRKSPHCIAAW